MSSKGKIIEFPNAKNIVLSDPPQEERPVWEVLKELHTIDQFNSYISHKTFLNNEEKKFLEAMSDNKEFFRNYIFDTIVPIFTYFCMENEISDFVMKVDSENFSIEFKEVERSNDKE